MYLKYKYFYNNKCIEMIMIITNMSSNLVENARDGILNDMKF